MLPTFVCMEMSPGIEGPSGCAIRCAIRCAVGCTVGCTVECTVGCAMEKELRYQYCKLSKRRSDKPGLSMWLL